MPKVLFRILVSNDASSPSLSSAVTARHQLYDRVKMGWGFVYSVRNKRAEVKYSTDCQRGWHGSTLCADAMDKYFAAGKEEQERMREVCRLLPCIAY